MKTLVIQSNSKANIKLLYDLAKKIGENPVIEGPVARSVDRGLKDLQRILKGKKAKKLDDLIDA